MRTLRNSAHGGARLRGMLGCSSRNALLTSTAVALALMLPAPARAQNATWSTNPVSGDFFNANNWSPNSVPTGTATFGTSTTTTVDIGSANLIHGGWTFNAGASNYIFNNASPFNNVFGFIGAGIIVNGGSATINNSQTLMFIDSSTAGSATINNNLILSFSNDSTAGSAAITNTNTIILSDSSSAGSAAITNNRNLNFYNLSTADSATITNSGTLGFRGNSTGGSATITNTGSGYLEFLNNSTAGNAAISNSSGGTVSFSSSTGLNGDNKISAGSIAGAGSYVLGANELTVGSNNLSTEVSGIIDGVGGSLVKTGTGTLTLSGANTYTGGTTVSSGILTLGSASGTGSILGAVAVDTGATFNVSNADTSGITTIVNNGSTYFRNSTTAGNATITNNDTLIFYDRSRAGSAAITNYGTLAFAGDSTANASTITNNSALNFNALSTAGRSTIINNDSLLFTGLSTAGNSTIINNSSLNFTGASTAGNASITNNVVGLVNFSASFGLLGERKLSAGSIAGAGNYILGANELTVGSNNFSTEVSGVISGTGSLVKTGTGTLTLSGANIYTGGTTINDGTLQLGRLSRSGSILGTVAVGAGATLDIHNANTSGITTIVNDGSTYFRNSTSAASAAITNNGNMFFSGTSTASTATITNNNSLLFYGFSTAGSAAIINNIGGQVSFASSTGSGADGRVSAGSIAGAGDYFLGSNELTVGSNNLSTEVSGAISGVGGSLVKTGTGTLILSDANSYTGGTLVDSGTLQLGNAGGVGSIVGAVAVNTWATLDFVNAATSDITTIVNNGSTYFRNSTSAATVSIINNNDMFFTDASTAGRATITNSSTLNFSDTSSAGSATITNNSRLNFSGSSTAESATIANTSLMNFSDTSTAWRSTIANDNFLNFSGTSTAGSATITNNSLLIFSDFSTADSATITNNSGGTVDFSDSTGPNGNRRLSAGSIAGAGNYLLGANELTVGSNNLSTEVSGVIAGVGGSLVKIGTGTLILSGANSYTGGTTIDGGTLQIGNGGTTGTLGAGGVTNNSILAFNRSDSYAVSNVISGTGAVVQDGSGTLTLSGTNTYTGTTTVNAGTLVVNGSIASSNVTMNAGTTLGGTGTVGATTIASGATLAPGNSIGTLTVNGNLNFANGAFYRVEVSPSNADRTNVNGIATLTGATVQALPLMGSFRAQTYTILSASGGLSGTFAGLTVNGSFSPARNPHLTYDTNTVFLVIDPGTIALPAGTSRNQTNVAGAINRMVESGGTPPAAFDNLLNMSGTQLSNSLTQASGEIGANARQTSFGAMNQFFNVLFDPSVGSGGAPSGTDKVDASAVASSSFTGLALSYHGGGAPQNISLSTFTARFVPRWRTWMTNYGGSNTTTGNSEIGSHNTSSRIFGTAMGADYLLSPDTRLRMAFGIGNVNFSTSNGLGSGKSNLYQAGLYAQHSFGSAYVATGVGYGWQDVTTDRTVTIAGLEKVEGKSQPQSFAARMETGYRFVTPWLGITPYVAGQATSFYQPGYTEKATSGSGAFALSYAAQTKTNVRTEVGVRLEKSFAVMDGQLSLRSRLAWTHDTNNRTSATASFQSLPGSTFTVSGARAAPNSALVAIAAEMAWQNGLSLGSSFEGEVAGKTRTYAGKGTLRYLW